ELISGLFLYTSIDPATSQRQSLTRRSNQSVPTVVDATRMEVSPDEMKATIILFCSLLDEQQRRLYAGLESLKLGHGHGGDRTYNRGSYGSCYMGPISISQIRARLRPVWLL